MTPSRIDLSRYDHSKTVAQNATEYGVSRARLYDKLAASGWVIPKGAHKVVPPHEVTGLVLKQALYGRENSHFQLTSWWVNEVMKAMSEGHVSDNMLSIADTLAWHAHLNVLGDLAIALWVGMSNPMFDEVTRTKLCHVGGIITYRIYPKHNS